MAEMSLTVFDMAVLFVVGVSAILALLRGLVRESLSVAVWILSALIAYAAFPELRQFMGTYIPNIWIADAATLIVVFIAPLVCLKIVAMVIAESVPSGILGSFDRILGAGYGFVRGAMLVSFCYLGLNLVNAPENHPTWIKEAQFLPYVRDGAELLANWVPENMLQADAWDGSGLGSKPAAAETLTPPKVRDLEEPSEGGILEGLGQ